MGVPEWISLAGVLAALLAAATTVWVFYRSIKTGTLDYQIFGLTALFPLRSRVGPDAFTILYGTSRVDNPCLVHVRIQNTGQRAVESADFHQPIRVRCLGTTLLNASISDASNDDLRGGTAVTIEDESSVVRPALLNSQDWFDIFVFCDGYPNSITVSAWFKNQSRIMKNMEEKRRRLSSSRVAIAAALLALLIPSAVLGNNEAIWWPFYLCMLTFTAVALTADA